MDVFPLLFNKLSQDGKSAPIYIGDWPSVDLLPDIEYPPIYYWLNTRIGAYVLSFNEPLLKKICFSEAYIAFGQVSLPPTEEDINKAVAQMQALSKSAFEKMIDYLQGELKRPTKESMSYKLGKFLSKLGLRIFKWNK